MKGIDIMTKYVVTFWDWVFGEETECVARNADGTVMLFDTEAEAEAKAIEFAEEFDDDYYVDIAPSWAY